jgi:hypothetical protein
MRRGFLQILVYASLASAGLAEEATRHFGPGIRWLHIDYPASFTTDPKSHQGEAKWWAKFVAPDKSLSIETMSHGYCSERLRGREGFRTPADYVLREVIPGSPLRTRHEGFDRLIRVDSASVTVIFLRHGEEWGKCYEELRFAFAEGSYEQHRDAIMKVIHSARPSFAKTDSEQAAPSDGDKPSN